MRDAQSLQREYKKCTGGGDGKPIAEKVCKDVEDGLMALGKFRKRVTLDNTYT